MKRSKAGSGSTMEASRSSIIIGAGFEMLTLDLKINILVRLPVSSLLRLRLVSKSWLTLIDNPYFISHHARRSTSENKLIILNNLMREGKEILNNLMVEEEDNGENEFNNDSYPFISIVDLGNATNQVDFNLSCQYGEDMVDQERNVNIVASFDGIVCLRHAILRDYLLNVVSLWNPATKHVKILPLPRKDYTIHITCFDFQIDYGFGFCTASNDYRVLRVVFEISVDGDQVLKSHVEVYSLNTDSWRDLGDLVPSKILIESNSKRPFGDGRVCWLGFDCNKKHPVLLSFNFNNELFDVISMEEVFGSMMKSPSFRGYQILAFLGEQLACIHQFPDSEDHHYHIWVLDKCGVKMSWTKLDEISLEPQLHPIGFLVNGNMVLKRKQHDWDSEPADLVVFDHDSRETTDIPFRGTLTEAAFYKESLVSVKGANGESYVVDSKWKTISSAWDLTVSQIILKCNERFTRILDQDAGSLIIFHEPKPVPHYFDSICFSTRWSPPKRRKIIVNTAATWKSSRKMGSIGWIARNSAGTAVKAAFSSPVGMLSILVGQAEAVRDALRSATNARWNQIIIESDYSPLVDMINEAMITKTYTKDSSISCIIRDILALCGKFSSVLFYFAPISLNAVAHTLAFRGLTCDSSFNWKLYDEVPDWLCDALAKDRRL